MTTDNTLLKLISFSISFFFFLIGFSQTPVGLPIETGGVRSFQLSEDGTRLTTIRTEEVPGGFNETGVKANMFEWDGAEWEEMGESPFLDIIGLWNNYYITTISSDGNRIAFNSLYVHDQNADFYSNVKVFEWIGSEWVKLGDDIPIDARAVSFSADGTRIVAGGHGISNYEIGYAKAYEWNGTNWTQVGQTIEGNYSTELFGGRVSLSGDGNRLTIGASGYYRDPLSKGATWIYEWDGTTWIPMNIAESPWLPASSAYFSSNGNQLINIESGTRKRYDWNGNQWACTATISDSLANIGHWQISADGNRIISDPAYRSFYINGTGWVHVVPPAKLFHWNGASWSESSPPIFPNGEADSLRISYSGDGNRIAVFNPNIGTSVYELAPQGFIYQFPVLCSNAPPSVFNNTVIPTGGTFSGPGIVTTDPQGNLTFDPSAVGAGIYSIDYTVDGETYSTSITVIDPIPPVLSLPDTLIITSTGLINIPGLGFPEGGHYSDDQGLLVDDANGLTFSLTSLDQTANAIITYTIEEENGCTISASKEVFLINESPNNGHSFPNQLGMDIQNQNTGSLFGHSVSLSADGNRMAVSAPKVNWGEVYVYERIGSDWVKMGEDIRGQVWQHDFGSDITLSADGNRLIVGIPGYYAFDYYGGYPGTGAIQMYEWDGTNWSSLGNSYYKLGNEYQSHFGKNIDMSNDGSLIVVNMSGHGSVLTYQDTGSGLSIINNAVLQNISAKDLAISGNGTRLVVGECTDTGEIHIYDWLNNDWEQIGQTIEQPISEDKFGSAIDISDDGNRIVVGAPQIDIPAAPGYVRIYDWNGSNWIQTGTDITGNSPGESFGASVAISSDGSRITIGASSNGSAGNSAGRAAIYEWNGSDWEEIQAILFGGDQAEDQFGFSVACSADAEVVAVGAIQENTLLSRGYVRVFAPFGAIFQNTFDPLCANAEAVNDLGGGYPSGGVYTGESVTDNGDGNTFSFDPAAAGVGDIVVIYTVDGEELTNTIEVFAAPNPSLALSDTIYIVPGTPLTVTGTGLPEGGNYSDDQGLVIDDGNGITFTLTSPDQIASITITYTVENEYGCSNSTSQLIAVIDEALNINTPSPHQLGLDIDGQQLEDQIGFGLSLSQYGTTMAVGAPNAGLSGEVYVYQLSGSDWVQMGQNITGQELWGDFGCAITLSANGDRLIAGIPSYTDVATGEITGGFQIYEWDGTNWASLGEEYLLHSGANNDQFGEAVSMSSDGTIFALGRPGSTTGAVEVYQDTGSGLSRLYNASTDNLLGANIGSRFGDAVALSGDGNRLIVGEPIIDNQNNNTGAVHIYDWNGTDWVQNLQPLQGTNSGDMLGYALAITQDGNRMIIGAPQTGAENASGYARIYDWDGSVWQQVGTDLLSANLGESFGRSVAISPDGSRIMIGAPDNAAAGQKAGRAALYEWNGDDWGVVENIIQGGDQANDQFGFSVACSSFGNIIAVGAIQTNSLAKRGYVRAFAPYEANFQSVFSAFCADATLQYNLGGAFPSGGVYSGVGVMDNGDGNTFSFDPTIAGTGQQDISYTIDDIEFDNTIEVLPLPVLSLGLTDTVFVTAGAPLTIAGNGAPIGGTYSSESNLFEDNADGLTFNFTGADDFVEAQTITYTYVNEAGCGNTISTDFILFDITVGVVDLKDLEIEVFPNPTAGILYLRGEDLKTTQLLDQNGRVLWQEQGDVSQIDLTRFPAGTYYLLIKLTNGQIGGQQVIKHSN